MTRHVHEKKTEFKDILKSLFTETERTNILNYFNTSSPEQLARRVKLRISKAEKIVKYRQENGNFSELHQIIEAPGLGSAGLTVACKEYLKDATDSEKKFQDARRRSKAVYPPVPVTILEKMEDLVTLDIQYDSIFWSKINRQLQVEDWKQTLLFDTPMLKIDHADINDQINKALEEIPEASIYVMEQKYFRFKDKKMSEFITNLQIIQWIIITTINLKRGKNVIYMMNPRIIDRMFDLSVGGERVTNKYIILDIAGKKLTGKNKFFNDVAIPRHLMVNYLQNGDVEQDKLTTSLLQGLAFYKSTLYKKEI